MKNGKIGFVKVKFKKFFGYVIWGLVIVFLISTVRNINRVISINRQVEEEKQKIEKIEADNKKLAIQIAEAQSSEFIENQIRNKLGYARSGETVVIMPDESIVRSLAPPETTLQASLPDPNWVKWKKLFF